MRLPAPVWLLVVAGLSPAGLVIASADPDPSAIERGQKIYADYCRSCHGEYRASLPAFAVPLEQLVQRLEGQLGQNMPDFFGVFTEAEVADLHAFLSAPWPRNDGS